jgi:molecular chaperone GrpE
MKKNKHTVENVEVNVEANQPVEVTENELNNELNNEEATTESLEDKCTALNDKNLRLMAEFDNYRKRTLKERMDLVKTAAESVLVDMLPLVDDFERDLKSMETTEDVQAVKDGMELIYSKFIAFLLQKGVKEIPTKDVDFDTEFHEAITTFPAPTEELKGKIIECATKGYTLNEKVIRFSKVVVGE